MTSGPTIETSRLILRPLQPEDFEPWVAFAADETTMRYLGGVQTRLPAWRGFMAVAATSWRWRRICGRGSGSCEAVQARRWSAIRTRSRIG